MDSVAATSEASEQKNTVPLKKERAGVTVSTGRYMLVAGLLSVAVNILLLVSPLYMIQVYDRVLSSASVSTLLSVSFIAIFLLSIYAFAEAGRRRALAVYGHGQMDGAFRRLSDWLLSKRRFQNAVDAKSQLQHQDVSRVQSAFFSGIVVPVFDLPFVPFYIGLMFLLHPMIGVIGLAGAIVLVGLAILSERITSTKFQADQDNENQAQSYLSELQRSANAVISMGMRDRVLDNWSEMKDKSLSSSLSTSSTSGFLSGLTKSFRQILQVLVLGGGAFLALQQQVSPGAIVAGSIIMGRGLAPIDQIVGGWKQLALAWNSWKKIKAFEASDAVEEPNEELEVSEITRGLICRNAGIGPPGAQQPILEPFDLGIDFGKTYVIVGPSGSGKSSLLQNLSGVWPVTSGKISLGNRDVSTWSDTDRGRFVGYLPQTVELLPGSVAMNISRFHEGRGEEVEELSRKIGFHELFMSFPKGYSTVIGRSGHRLSAGQSQAIGLARACFGESRLLLLDEPTANLDAGLAGRFMAALDMLKASGKAIVLTTHDSRLIPRADMILSTQGGRLREIENPTKNKVVKPDQITQSGNGRSGQSGN